MSFLTPLGLLGLVLVPILLALHFFRRRPTRRAVSNAYLWKQPEASPPQLVLSRIRRNLQLLMQLAALLLLVFAMAGPVVTWLGGGRTVVLVFDLSASMGANEGDVNRLELAQREALDVLGGFGFRDRVVIVAAWIEPEVIGDFETNSADASSAIAGLMVTERAADVDDAVELVLARQEFANAAVYVFTDLAGSRAAPVEVGSVTYVRVGASIDNVAITRFEIRSNPYSAHDGQAFVEIANFGEVSRRGTLLLVEEASTLLREGFELAPGERATYFESVSAPRVEAILEVDDALGADNRAFALNGLAATRSILVVTPGNPFLVEALRVYPFLDVEVMDTEGYPSGLTRPYDVVVCDGCDPVSGATRGYLSLKKPQPGGARGRASVVENGHPVTRLLDFGSIPALRFEPVDAGEEWQVLLRVRGRPALSVSESEPARRAMLGVDASSADFTLRPAFPILVSNLIEWLSAPRPGEARAFSGAVPVRLAVGQTDDPVEVMFPDGVVHRVRAEGGFATPVAGKLGFYLARWPGGVRPFAINLLDEAESDIQVGSVVGRGRAPAATSGSSVLWWTFLFLAFLLLIAEWLYGGRRHRHGGNSNGTVGVES